MFALFSLTVLASPQSAFPETCAQEKQTLNPDTDAVVRRPYDTANLQAGTEAIRKMIMPNGGNITFGVNWVDFKHKDKQLFVNLVALVNRNFANNNVPINFELLDSIMVTGNVVFTQDDCTSNRLIELYGNPSPKVLNAFSGSPNSEAVAFTMLPHVNAHVDAIFLGDYDSYPADFYVQTITHEIGHWFGLFHTFQTTQGGDGCSDTVNDYVRDTPIVSIRQRTATTSFQWACNVVQDTCPRQPGTDLINNYMDYTKCRNSFTDGQIFRMMNFAYFRYMGKMPTIT